MIAFPPCSAVPRLQVAGGVADKWRQFFEVFVADRALRSIAVDRGFLAGFAAQHSTDQGHSHMPVLFCSGRQTLRISIEQ